MTIREKAYILVANWISSNILSLNFLEFQGNINDFSGIDDVNIAKICATIDDVFRSSFGLISYGYILNNETTIHYVKVQ